MQGSANRLKLDGKRFGRLSVIEFASTTSYGKTMWKCRCDCGCEKIVAGSHLTSGAVQSCGCLGKEKRALSSTTHGGRNSNLYGVWAGMKSRCSNPNNEHYKNYGGRGIAVCAEWESDFQSFSTWALANGYSVGLTIERINNDGNYCPENCRWANRVEQIRNRRTTLHIEISGDTKTLKEWAEESDIPYTTLWSRYKRGVTGENLIRKV